MVLGETFVGPEAFRGAAGKVAFGLLVHLVTSVGLATLVAALLPADFPTASAIGVGVGLVLLSFMFVLMPLLVPWAHPGFRAGMQGMGGTWIAGLAVFGATLGAGPALRRWAARGASRQAREDVALGGRTGAVAAAGRKA